MRFVPQVTQREKLRGGRALFTLKGHEGARPPEAFVLTSIVIKSGRLNGLLKFAPTIYPSLISSEARNLLLNDPATNCQQQVPRFARNE